MIQVLKRLVGLMLLVVVGSVAADSSRPFELVFFDVGQGSALLLQQPEACQVLVDAGPLDRGAQLVEQLQQRGIDGLERVVVTHPHIDHFGGVFALPTGFSVAEVNDNGKLNSNWVVYEPYQRWRDNRAYQPLQRGDWFDCGRARVEVLWPPADRVAQLGINDSSLVMRVELGQTRVLLSADVGPKVKTELMRQPDQLDADILLVAHHGGDLPLAGWMEAVDPQLAVISVGNGNRFGSPKTALIEHIQQAGVALWRTDQQGDLQLELGEHGYRIIH